MCSHAVVQAAGEAYRVPAQVLQDEFNRGGATMQLLLRYTQALLTQVAQRAVCNRHHSLAQQLARCLLLTLGVFSMFYIRERRLWVWLKDRDAGSVALMAMSSQRKTLDFEKDYRTLKQLMTQPDTGVQ